MDHAARPILESASCKENGAGAQFGLDGRKVFLQEGDNRDLPNP